MIIQLLSLICVIRINPILCFDCETKHFNNPNGGYISSPNFPEANPDGPFNCTYIITNTNGGLVLLEFTDDITHRQFSSDYGCRERLSFSERNSESGEVYYITFRCYLSIVLNGNYQASTLFDTLIVKYEVTDTNLLGIPGFKARYYMVERDEFLFYQIDRYRRGRHEFFKVPYRWKPKGDLSSNPDDNRQILYSAVASAAPNHHVSLDFENINEDMGDNSVIEVHDGMTSESPLIARWTVGSDVRTVFSTAEYLYFSIRLEYDQSFTFSYVSFLTTGGDCPDGYYKCATNDRCIGTSGVCDGYNHCGDNSDEIHPSLNCSKVYPCLNGGSPWTDFGGQSSCSNCKDGYVGRFCEYGTKVAPASCKLDCKNGGTCERYVCRCRDGYIGVLCELRDENYIPPPTPPPFRLSKKVKTFLIIFIPVLVFFFIVGGGTLYLARRMSHRRSSYTPPMVTVPAVTYDGNCQTVTTVGVSDNPPNYDDAVRNVDCSDNANI
ncbi:uncharacterized protein LOC144439542 isoform X2 [Glandiceps talaboti]